MLRGPQQTVLGLKPLAVTQSMAELHLSTQDRQEPGVVPRLLDKIPRAATHGLDGNIQARPSRHHHYWQHAVESLKLCEQVKTFLPGSCIARVVKVDQKTIKGSCLH